MLDLIWIETVWHSDGADGIPEKYVWKSSFRKKSADNKKAYKITQEAKIHSYTYIVIWDAYKNIFTFMSWSTIFLVMLEQEICLWFFVWFDSLRPLNNLSVMRDGSSWVEPVLS